jgi:hypothetical protein
LLLKYINVVTILYLGSTKDVHAVHQSIQEVIDGIEYARNDGELYEELFSSMEQLGGELEMPRAANHQTLRANHPAESAKHYFKIAYYLPYCEHLVADLKKRFESSPGIAQGLSDYWTIN